MEITNDNNASKAGDISTGATDTAALDAISTSTSPATTGYSPDPTLGADESVNYGNAEEEGADTSTTSPSYGTDLTDGVQLSGDQRTNNVEAVNIRGSDVGGSDK